MVHMGSRMLNLQWLLEGCAAVTIWGQAIVKEELGEGGARDKEESLYLENYHGK